MPVATSFSARVLCSAPGGSGSAGRPARTGSKGGSGSKKPSGSAPPADPAPWATRPVQISSERVLGRVEKAPSPQWSTFAGAAAGVWAGSGYAASPFTGALEPLGLDETGQPTVTSVWTRRLTVRDIADGEPVLRETLWQQPVRPRQATHDSEAQLDEFTALGESSMQPGLLFYCEDGSFSDGPQTVGDPDADGVFTVEHCLCVGGRQRVRVTQTLQRRFLFPEEDEDMDGEADGDRLDPLGTSASNLYDALNAAGEHWKTDAGVEEEEAVGDEDDEEEVLEEDMAPHILVQQLRVRVTHEAWCGPQGSGVATPAVSQQGGEVGQAHGSTPPATPVPAASAAVDAVIHPPMAERLRAVASQLGKGTWTVFVRAGSVSMKQGDAESDDPQWTWAHEVYEREHKCSLPPGKPSARLSIDEESLNEDARIVQHESAAALWLPGGVTSSLCLGAGPDGGGMVLSAGWVVSSDGTAVSPVGYDPDAGLVYCSMEREYDSRGDLVEVRYGTATRPGAQGRIAGGG